jgi:class 3 adenylate cyclase
LRITLRYKLLGYSVALAVLPLAVASRSMIRITQDELKSSANDEISNTAGQVTKDIDALYADTWLAPLLLVQSGIESERLGIEEKLALLRFGIQNIGDVVACQISAEGGPKPILISKDAFTARLAEKGLDPTTTLLVDPDRLARLRAGRKDEVFVGGIDRIDATDDWLLTIVSPLHKPLNGLRATFIARVDMTRIRSLVESHPFTKRGSIKLVDAQGLRIFDSKKTDLSAVPVVADAKALLASGSRAIGAKPYVRPSGEKMLAAYAFPARFDWFVLAELNEDSAYLAVRKMATSLKLWVLIGLGVAGVGGFALALGISRPVEAIARTAREVGKGNLDVVLQDPTSNDEIADLAIRMREMIKGLRDRDFIRDTFGRYVSPEVVQRVLSDPSALHPGGEVRTVTIMFSDLRGFTSLSEQLSPPEMVALLNSYLGRMADIVSKNGGTVIEFIGDAIMALFGAPTVHQDDPLHAVACAAEMQTDLLAFNAEYGAKGVPPLQQGVGIATGSVIVGNIGSEKRMKYGVVGDDVNLAARAESFTVGGEVLVSEVTRNAVGDRATFRGPIEVKAKGKKEPLRLFALVSVKAGYDLDVPVEHELAARMGDVSIPVDCYTLAGKVVSTEAVPATFVKLGAGAAVIEIGQTLEAFDNVMLRIRPPGESPIESVYAKVRSVHRKGDLQVCQVLFTSIPEADRARFAALAPVPE